MSTNGCGLARVAGGVLALMLAAAPPAGGAEHSGCAAFLWPIAKEQAAFARPDLPTVSSGTARGAWTEQAFALKLEPQAQAVLPVPPGGKPMTKVDKPFAGTVTFDAPAAAGVYHVTLSAPAWIDLVQGGTPLQAAAFTGAHDCASVHKSVRFELTKAPLVLEISGAPAAAIKIAIVRAVD
jgi:hypothetical protein